MANPAETLLLAGDVGGTKTKLGLFAPGKARPRPLRVRSFPSRKAGGVEELILRFLGEEPPGVAAACIGVAGPVRNGRCRTTNLPWEVSEGRLSRQFGWPALRLLNDVQATAFSLPLLRGGELRTLQPGRADPEGVRALVAPGTGLGLALLLAGPSGTVALPSEGGHADFAPRNEREMDLHRYLALRFGHVSLERVLSGPGLFHIYSWLRDTGKGREPRWLSRALEAGDPPAVIAEAGLSRRDARCREVLSLFTAVLGATAGNLALTALATGGVYLGGGIPPKILPALQDRGFTEAFSDKGRFRKWAAAIPVRVILNEDAALLGAAQQAALLAAPP